MLEQSLANEQFLKRLLERREQLTAQLVAHENPEIRGRIKQLNDVIKLATDPPEKH